MRKHGPWTIHRTATVYEDPWMRVVRDEVTRPDGSPGTYCVAHIKHGVSVLALSDDGVAHLTREFHYGVGRDTLEVVSGGIDEAESPEEAARRELKEELGITADRWTDLGVVDPFTSMVCSPTRLFLAQGLKFGREDQEGTEQIHRVAMPFEDAVNSVMNGRITHAPSCVVILKAKGVLSK
jgi:ADP-ribose pyrophosphatase